MIALWEENNSEMQFITQVFVVGEKFHSDNLLLFSRIRWEVIEICSWETGKYL